MFLGPVAKVLGWILEQLANFLNVFGVMNTGLTIILFTFLINTLMLPLTIRQYKFQKLQSSIAPELARIQKKYKGKKDEVSLRKQQAETSALYQKFGTSPTSGCLPMLITLPILFALYRVIYHIPGYVDLFYKQYDELSTALLTLPDIGKTLDTWAQTQQINSDALLQLPFDKWPVNIAAIAQTSDYAAIKNNMVEFLSQLKSVQWDEFAKLAKTIGGPENLMSLVDSTREAAMHMNSFLGMNIMDAPTFTSYSVVIPVAAAGFQFLQTKLMPTATTDDDAPGASMMKSMNVVMPIMSGVFCFILPIGVGLYWVAGSVYRIIQQIFVNAYMKKLDVEDLVKKNVEKQNKKRARSGLEPLKIEEISKTKTSTIETIEERTKANKKKSEPSDYKRNGSSYSANSIAANANLLAKKNGEKGDK